MGEGARPKCRYRPPFSSPPGFHDSDVPNGLGNESATLVWVRILFLLDITVFVVPN